MKTALLVLLITGSLSAQWTAGFNFRRTAGFVADPAGTTWAIQGVTSYPTVRTVSGVSVTFGWQPLPSVLYQADYRTDVDPRLAGTNCHLNTGTPAVFRIDVPATGRYDIEIAAGDIQFAQQHRITVESGTTQLLSLDGETLSHFFFTAQGQKLDNGTWASDPAPLRVNLTSTFLTVSLGGTAGGGYSCLTHFRISQLPPEIRRVPSRTFSLQ